MRSKISICVSVRANLLYTLQCETPCIWVYRFFLFLWHYQNSRRKSSVRVNKLANLNPYLEYDYMDTWMAAQCSGLDSLMRRHRSGKMHWYKGWGSSFSKSSWSFCTCTCLFSARIWHSSSRWRSLQVHVSAAVRVHNGSWQRWHLDYKEEE